MRKFLHCVYVLSILALSSTGVKAGTVYSKASVAASGNGKVYIEKNGDNGITNGDLITRTSMEQSQSSGSNSNSTATSDHFYTLYAKPDKGYAFKQWVNKSASDVTVKGIKFGEDGANSFTATDNPLSIRVTTTSKQESSPVVASMQAEFVSSTLTVSSNNYGLGFASIDKVENSVGDVVTVTAKFNTPHATWQNAAYQKHSNSVTFDGWYNESGECLSREISMSLIVEKAENIEARFSREFVLKGDSEGTFRGYFRMSAPFSKEKNTYKFLCITGNFQPSINTSSGTAIHAAMEFNSVPYSKDPTYFLTDAVYSDAGSIIYVTGTMEDAGKNNTVAAHTKVVSNLVAEAQGVSTKSILNGRTPWLSTSNTQGFYMLYLADGATLQWTSTESEAVYCSTDHLNLANNRDCGDFDIQPIDLDHIDTNYFGAYPAQEMMMTDSKGSTSYWASMYTSFPYECYELDGVEAYVVRGIEDGEGTSVARVEKLEGNIVPAETPVLLKCRSTNPKENRLLPLLPDDSRIASVEVGNNLLKGEYSLWTAADYTGRPKFDTSKMRVFSVNSEGQLGFYNMSADTELLPNRAYLDMEALNGAQKAPSFRIVFDNGLASIDNVLYGNESDLPEEYYTLQGFKVSNPERGNIYIVRKGNKVRKVIF